MLLLKEDLRRFRHSLIGIGVVCGLLAIVLDRLLDYLFWGSWWLIFGSRRRAAVPLETSMEK